MCRSGWAFFNHSSFLLQPARFLFGGLSAADKDNPKSRRPNRSVTDKTCVWRPTKGWFLQMLKSNLIQQEILQGSQHRSYLVLIVGVYKPSLHIPQGWDDHFLNNATLDHGTYDIWWCCDVLVTNIEYICTFQWVPRHQKMAVRCIFAIGVACWANYSWFFSIFDCRDCQSSRKHGLFGHGLLSKNHFYTEKKLVDKTRSNSA